MTLNVAKVAVRWVATAVHGIGVPADEWDFVCTFHVMKAASEPEITAADRHELNMAVLRWWEEDQGGFVEVKSAYPPGLALVSVETRNIEPAIGDPTIADLLEPLPGNNNGLRGLLPPQCCLLVGLRTAVDTRRGRGRMYLPAYTTEPHLEAAGLVDADQRTDLGHIAAHLAYEVRSVYAGVEDGPFVLAVYSRAGQDATPVTHFEIPNRIRTQRRRALVPTYSAHSLSTGEPA